MAEYHLPAAAGAASSSADRIVQIPLPDHLLARVDAHASEHGSTRSATIRELAEVGLGERQRRLAQGMAELEGQAQGHGGNVAQQIKVSRTRVIFLDASVLLAAEDTDDAQHNAASALLRTGTLATLDLALYETTNIAIARWKDPQAAARLKERIWMIAELGTLVRVDLDSAKRSRSSPFTRNSAPTTPVTSRVLSDSGSRSPAATNATSSAPDSPSFQPP